MHHPKKQKQSRCTRQALIAALLLATLAVTSCKHGNAINFVTNTQFGVKVGVNAEKIPEINIGYSRQEAARVPVYLETSKDQLSASPPTINALLNSTADSLNKAKASPWGQANVDAVKVARQLIDKCVATDTASATNTTSTLLREIKTAADGLSVDPDPTKGTSADKVEFVRQLIFAEMSKPRFFAEFNEHAKYIGTRSDGNYRDAYSVLGTFRGGGSGSTTGAQANMKIAQYFATGIAAQLLAEKGGAAIVNPSAKAPTSLTEKEVAQMKKDSEDRKADAEKVAAKVWADPDPNARRNVLTTAFRGIRAERSQSDRDRDLNHYAAVPNESDLVWELRQNFLNLELCTMVKNLNP